MQIYSFLSFDGIFQQKKYNNLTEKQISLPFVAGVFRFRTPFPPLIFLYHQHEDTETRILSLTDPTEVTDFHWLIRDFYGW